VLEEVRDATRSLHSVLAGQRAREVALALQEHNVPEDKWWGALTRVTQGEHLTLSLYCTICICILQYCTGLYCMYCTGPYPCPSVQHSTVQPVQYSTVRKGSFLMQVISAMLLAAGLSMMAQQVQTQLETAGSLRSQERGYLERPGTHRGPGAPGRYRVVD